jgi:hypothetical protein
MTTTPTRKADRGQLMHLIEGVGLAINVDQPSIGTSVRRRELLSAAVGAATLLLVSKGALAQPRVDHKILIPMPAAPWTHAAEIVGKRADTRIFYNDFCLAQDRAGRWHCIGIIGGSGIEPGAVRITTKHCDQIKELIAN